MQNTWKECRKQILFYEENEAVEYKRYKITFMTQEGKMFASCQLHPYLISLHVRYGLYFIYKPVYIRVRNKSDIIKVFYAEFSIEY